MDHFLLLIAGVSVAEGAVVAVGYWMDLIDYLAQGADWGHSAAVGVVEGGGGTTDPNWGEQLDRGCHSPGSFRCQTRASNFGETYKRRLETFREKFKAYVITKKNTAGFPHFENLFNETLKECFNST